MPGLLDISIGKFCFWISRKWKNFPSTVNLCSIISKIFRTHLQKADQKKTTFHSNTAVYFPLGREKRMGVYQTSKLTAAASLASLLFCCDHSSAYRPPFDRRKSCGPCSTTVPFSKTMISSHSDAVVSR